MASTSLLAGLYAEKDLKACFTRQRCGPQPAMRRVEESHGRYSCWLQEDHGWRRLRTVRDRNEAVSWWLGDPWLPNQDFEYGVLADGADVAGGGPGDGGAGWDAARWADANAALAFHVVSETGARPHEVGPESTETGAHVYQRLCTQRAAAQIYWYEGRSRWEVVRGSCRLLVR